MNDSDKANFTRLMTSFAELHNKKLSQQLLSIYWYALKQYEYKDVMRSLNHIIIDPDVGRFMPKPADIVRCIDGDSDTKALFAWSKVMRAIHRYGAWESVKFDDDKIHVVIMDMGGWIELCRKSTKELGFLSREFERRYRAYQYQNIEQFPPRLVGRMERGGGYQDGNQNVHTKLIGTHKNTAALRKLNHAENN